MVPELLMTPSVLMRMPLLPLVFDVVMVPELMIVPPKLKMPLPPVFDIVMLPVAVLLMVPPTLLRMPLPPEFSIVMVAELEMVPLLMMPPLLDS